MKKGIQSRCRAEPATVLDLVRRARFVDERRMGFARGPRFAAGKVDAIFLLRHVQAVQHVFKSCMRNVKSWPNSYENRPPNRLKICYFGPPGVSRGGLERPGPPGGGVPTLFGRILGPSGGALGPPWGVLGPSWGAPGASWAVLGAPWARLGASRGDLGRSWACLGALFGRLGRDCRESTKTHKKP